MSPRWAQQSATNILLFSAAFLEAFSKCDQKIQKTHYALFKHKFYALCVTSIESYFFFCSIFITLPYQWTLSYLKDTSTSFTTLLDKSMTILSWQSSSSQRLYFSSGLSSMKCYSVIGIINSYIQSQCDSKIIHFAFLSTWFDHYLSPALHDTDFRGSTLGFCNLARHLSVKKGPKHQI